MSIDIVPINGKCPYFNYALFEQTLVAQIGKRCTEAKVILINNFPIPISTESNIDLVLIISIGPVDKNFYIPKVLPNGKPVYFNNQIIPVRFITHLAKKKIATEADQLLLDEEELIDFSTEVQSIKNGLQNYLVNRCQFSGEKLFINPLIFVQNEQELVLDNCLVAPVFNFSHLHRFFKENSADIFISVQEWRNVTGYHALTKDVERITNQASWDSQLGFLTKKKIDRISSELSKGKQLYEYLNQNLIIVKGKAGTGKSNVLLQLAMKCITKGNNVLYLTYNKLLVFDIARTIKFYVDNKLNAIREEDDIPGEAGVVTLHQFFFKISRSLGVLHLMSEVRIAMLLKTLKERLGIIQLILRNGDKVFPPDYRKLKTIVQNNPTLEIAVKEVGIDFLNYCYKQYGEYDFGILGKMYFEHKKQLLENIEVNAAFLADYYGVLQNTMLAINDSEGYFRKYGIQDKFDLLQNVMKLKEKHVDVVNNQKVINLPQFKQFMNRKVGGHKRKRTVLIDEAQDCHRLEKEILIAIFKKENLVVADGGKEQLIRHVELCNWEAAFGARIPFYLHRTRSKSYRIKNTVLDFCNFVANQYKIDLNLELLKSEDEGELIFDFRTKHTDEHMTNIFSVLKTKGEVNGCTAYENTLILQHPKFNGNTPSVESAIINEYGNIEDNKYRERPKWQFIDALSKKDIDVWDGSVADKSKLTPPGSNQARLIYYESCRGLEAWSVACLGLDRFFEIKVNDPDAERYLVGDRFLENEERKDMFAATWVLMAITRAIDTLYIQVESKYSKIGELIQEYVAKGNRNVRVIS